MLAYRLFDSFYEMTTLKVVLYSNFNSYWKNKKVKRAEKLSHWGRVTHICVNKLTTIVSDNGLSPGRRQAIIWTNAGILLIRKTVTGKAQIHLCK